MRWSGRPAGHASYYKRWAHTWEFQALLKARPAAGDPDARAAVPGDHRARGVVGAPGRDSFVDDVQAMRRRVEDNIPERHRDRELKLGAGGLRDVEFAVQLLQLVHGRTDPDLRLPGTLMGLRSLIRGGYVGRTDGAEMAAAYTFLRRAEHRLQLQRLRRTHLLPDDSVRHGVAGPHRRLHRRPAPSSAAEVFIAERLRHARHGPPAAREAVLPAAAACGRGGRRATRCGCRRRRPAPGWPPSASSRRTPRCGTSGGPDRRGQPAGRHPAAPCCRCCSTTSRPAPTRTAGCCPTGRCPRRSPTRPGTCGCCATRARSRSGSPTLLGGSRLIASLLTRAPEVLRLLVDDAALLAPEPETVAAALLARSAPRRNRQGGGGRRPVRPPAGDAPAGLRRPARPDLGDQHRPRADQRRRDHASARPTTPPSSR